MAAVVSWDAYEVLGSDFSKPETVRLGQKKLSALLLCVRMTLRGTGFMLESLRVSWNSPRFYPFVIELWEGGK